MASERIRHVDVLACASLSLLAAAIVAAAALRAGDLPGPLLVLSAVGVTLGCAFPHRVLLVGIVLGVGIPLAHVGAHLVGLKQVSMASHVVWAFLPIVPALVTSALGALLRRSLP